MSDHDPVNHPSHYTQVPGVECIDVTRHFSFNRGNAIKYVWRAGSKGSEVEDLRKAVWYLRDELRRLGAPDAQEAAENAELETLRERVRHLEILNEGHVESWRMVQQALGGCSGKSLRDATLDAIAVRDELRRTIADLGSKPQEQRNELVRLRATLDRVRAAADMEPCRAAVLEALGDG